MASDSNHARRSLRLSSAGASDSEMALPARIQHFLGRMSFLPAGVISDQPQMASGLTGALPIWAMSAKPPWTSGLISRERMRVPSGKIRTSSPRCSACWAARRHFMSAVPRSTGMPPTRLKAQRTILLLANSDLKMGRTRRPPKNSAVSTARSSAIEVWLQMTTLPRPSWRSNSRSASSTFQRHMSLEKTHRMPMTTKTVPRMSTGNSA